MNSFCCLRPEKIEKIIQLKLPTSQIAKNTFSNKLPIIIQDINMNTISSKKSKKKSSNNKNSKYRRNIRDNLYLLKNANLKEDKSNPSKTINDINFIIDRKERIRTGRNIKRERDNEFIYSLKILCLYQVLLRKGVFLVMSN